MNPRYVFLCTFSIFGFLLGGLTTVKAVAAAPVRVWEGGFAWATYEEGPPNPNPAFDQFSSNTNYPYTVRDQLTNHRVEHTWRAVYLENEYLKCTILPDLGGHIYTCVDKISGQPMFYANPTLKKANIGYRGGWAAYGVEFNFPVSHNWVTASPVNYACRTNADGSASVFVNNIERVYGMEWTVEAILHPGSTVLELKVTLTNRADIRHRFYWWSNAGIEVWDDSRVSYPMQFTASHGFKDIDTWPVDSTGTDLSLLKNQVFGPVSRFVHGSSEPFMGIWHPHTGTGVVHYAEHQELPGKKIWSWGSDADGMDWRKTLSDNNSAYMEVQGGLFRNQETYAFLEPRQTIHFTEYWMPARELGGITRANLNGIAYLGRDGAELKTALNVNRLFAGATVQIDDGKQLVLQETLDLKPEKTWKGVIAPAATDVTYTLTVKAADGKVLLRQKEGEFDWTSKEDVQRGPQTAYKIPDAQKRSEDDWIALGREEELNGARLAAFAHYKEALTRLPESLLLHKAAGRLAADLLLYDEAVAYLTPVSGRESWNAETAYYLGIAYDGLHRYREARLAYGIAYRLPEFHAAASMRLAELEARAGHLAAAAADLEEDLRSAPDDMRAAEELVAVHAALGQKETAKTLAEKWLAFAPTSFTLREELGASDNAHLAADADRILGLASMYMRLGLYANALDVLSRDYPATPADQREPGEPAPARHPMVSYYRAYCLQRLGRPAGGTLALASSLPTKYVFPSGAMSDEVLRAAVTADAKDATATYLLGTLEFSTGRTEDGLEKWRRAAALNEKLPSVDASIGRALFGIHHDAEGALVAFERGVENDPENVEDYLGADRAMSVLQLPAAKRSEILARYPGGPEPPTDLVYELALNLAEAGQFDRARALFEHRYFSRAEGGTNVREVWLELRILEARSLAEHARCNEAQSMLHSLGSPVEGLEFTRDGLQPILDTARSRFLIGEVFEACKNPDEARNWFAQAARVKELAQAAWAARATVTLGSYDDAQWKAQLERALTAVEEDDSSALNEYQAALLKATLGDTSGAAQGYRAVFDKQDTRMAYHLARMETEQTGK
jgi:Flp pilus assembly protein TadD